MLIELSIIEDDLKENAVFMNFGIISILMIYQQIQDYDITVEKMH